MYDQLCAIHGTEFGVCVSEPVSILIQMSSSPKDYATYVISIMLYRLFLPSHSCMELKLFNFEEHISDTSSHLGPDLDPSLFIQ